MLCPVFSMLCLPGVDFLAMTYSS